MKIGYARVSTDTQNLDLQIDALRAAGCDRIFTDRLSGSLANRPGLDDLLDRVRPGDTLVVWRLDRLGRSLRHLIETVEKLQAQEVAFISLTESIDTTTSGGKLIFHLFGAFAEFERNILRERTQAGLAAARARGKKGGRKQTISQKKLQTAEILAESSQQSIKEICQSLGISRSTYYRRTKPIE